MTESSFTHQLTFTLNPRLPPRAYVGMGWDGSVVCMGTDGAGFTTQTEVLVAKYVVGEKLFKALRGQATKVEENIGV